MDIGPGWQELRTQSRPHKCPKLFYKFTADESGYRLALTDLVGLWTSERETEGIREYAKATRATIDPTENSQLKKLLEKLFESLDSGSTSIQQDDSRGSESLNLSTIIQLKRPLLPLKWVFKLEPQGAVEMAEEILRPCLHEAFYAQEKIRSLFEVIASKDRAIAKLLDKFETSAMDLSLVFPSITGVRARKGSLTVQQAKRHVAGLGEFDRSEWLTIFESDGPYSSFETDGLSKLIIGCQKCTKHTSKEHHQWLHKLPKASATASQRAQIDAIRSSSPVKDSSDSETQFETQKKRKLDESENDDDSTSSEANPPSTIKKLKRSLPKNSQRNDDPKLSSPVRSSSPMLPPAPKSASIQSHEASPDSSDTSSEMDLDAAPRAKSNAKLGTLTSKKSKSANSASRSSTRSPALSQSPAFDPPSTNSHIPSSPPPDGPNPNAKKRPKSSSSTMTANSEKELQAKAAAAKEAEPSRSPSTPRKLGRLGALRNSESATPEKQRTCNVSASNSRSNNSSNQGTPTRRRLGRLGGGASQSSQAPGNNMTSKNPSEASPAPDAGAESDASTASTASPSPSPPASPSATAVKTHTDTSSRPPSRHEQFDPKGADSTTSQSQSRLQSQSSLTDQQPTPEPEVEELTKEEKANRRREELKRKFEQPGTNAGRGGSTNAGAGGLRKKRKF